MRLLVPFFNNRTGSLLDVGGATHHGRAVYSCSPKVQLSLATGGGKSLGCYFMRRWENVAFRHFKDGDSKLARGLAFCYAADVSVENGAQI
jgi:hypothetical protein